jgi:hypothetical protein
VVVNVCVQELTLPADALDDDATLAKSMLDFAKRVIETSTVNRDIGPTAFLTLRLANSSDWDVSG